MLRSRPFVVLAAATMVAVAALPSATAHTEVQRATPGPGATVEAPVDEIELVFLDPVMPGVTIEVAIDGEPVGADGAARLDDAGRVATLVLDGIDDSGAYVVSYRYVALDGAQQQGSYRFRVTAPSRSTEESGRGAVGGLVFLVLAGSALAVAVRRRVRVDA